MHDVSKKVQWSKLADFNDPESGMTVRVNVSDHKPRKRYSMQIGRLVVDTNTNQEKVIPFVSVFVGTQHAQVTEVRFSPEVLRDLTLQATNLIWAEAQAQEDRLISDKIEREGRNAFREPAKTGLKTLAKQDKAKRAIGAQ